MKLSTVLASTLTVTSASPVESWSQSELSGPGTGRKWINCYYTNWPQYRPGLGKYMPENIDATLCTHIYFAFAKMCQGGGGWTLCPYEWKDQDEPWSEGMYTRVQKKKQENPELKVSLAVGGWNHGSAGFKEMVSSRSSMETWTRNAVKYSLDNGFDGIDLDWEYPAKTTVDTSPPEDYENFQTLCEIMRDYIDNNHPGFLLTAAVGIGKDKIYRDDDNNPPSYNVKHLSDHMDMINLMTYDIHGHWEDKTGHHALAHTKLSDDRLGGSDSFEWIIENWLLQQADPQKLALGLPAFGRSFTLENANNHGYMAPCKLGSNGLYSGSPGTYTREGGYLAYYEICEKLRSGEFTEYWDEEGKVPYAYGGDQWVGYDNIDSIQYKVRLAQHYNLGGIMWWATDIDDFTDTGTFCHQGRYPLMTAAKQVWHEGYTPTGSPPTTDGPNTTKSTTQVLKQIQLPILLPAQGVAVHMVSIIRMKMTAQNTISVIMEIILISNAALDFLGIPTVKLVTGIPTLIAVTDNALAPAKI